MQKTAIPWADYSINPVKGLCPMDCKDLAGKPYCYARKMYKRFHLRKDGTVNPAWDYTIRFEPLDYIKYPAGSKVFVGSTMELFGDWVKSAWLEQIFEWCRRLPDVIFIFLTKQPQNLARWSPFPPNCYTGVSVTNQRQYDDAIKYLKDVDAKVKFLSIEPLLERIDLTA